MNCYVYMIGNRLRRCGAYQVGFSRVIARLSEGEKGGEGRSQEGVQVKELMVLICEVDL